MKIVTVNCMQVGFLIIWLDCYVYILWPKFKIKRKDLKHEVFNVN